MKFVLLYYWSTGEIDLIIKLTTLHLCDLRKENHIHETINFEIYRDQKTPSFLSRCCGQDGPRQTDQLPWWRLFSIYRKKSHLSYRRKTWSMYRWKNSVWNNMQASVIMSIFFSVIYQQIISALIFSRVLKYIYRISKFSTTYVLR